MMIDRRTPSNPVLRVLVLTPLGPNGRGGIDRLMDSIAVEVRTNPINGLQLDFLTTRGKGAITAPLVFATTLLRLALVLWTGRFDVVHINLASYGSAFRKMILAHLCRSFDVPYVIHLHGAHFHKFWASSSPPLRKRIDAIFAISEG